MTWDKYRHDLEVLVQVAETAGTRVTLSYREARKLLDRLDAAEEAVEAVNVALEILETIDFPRESSEVVKMIRAAVQSRAS